MSEDYREITGEGRTCQETDFAIMTEQLQQNYLDKYECLRAEIHQAS